MNNCSEIRNWLPLYAGGDLGTEKMERVAAHLAGCAGCAQTAQELQAARDWLRSTGAPEFDDRTLAGLRHAIRREIEKQEHEPSGWAWLTAGLRPAILAGAVILLAAALAFWWRNRNTGEIVRRGTPPQVVDIRKSSARQPVSDVADLNPAIHRRAHRVSRQVHGGAPTFESHVAEALPAENTQADRPLVRLEIQTADPNIRIIWLTPGDAPVRTESIDEFK